MNNVTKSLLLGCAVSVASSASFAGCNKYVDFSYPEIMDGMAVTVEQARDNHALVKRYVDDMSQYADYCRDSSGFNDMALSNAQTVAKRFNRQLKVFRVAEITRAEAKQEGLIVAQR